MSIIIFSASFLGAFVMVLFRLYELKVERATFASRLIARSEKYMERFQGFIKGQMLKIARYFHDIILEHASSQKARLAKHLNEFVGKKYFAFTELLYGRQVLQNRGSASFFLQRISANKRRVTTLDSLDK